MLQDWEVLARESARGALDVLLIPEALFYYRTTASSMAQAASVSRLSQLSDRLYMRAFLNQLPLGLGPLVPYIVRQLYSLNLAHTPPHTHPTHTHICLSPEG